MTTEYTPGSENIGVICYAYRDGTVSLRFYKHEGGEIGDMVFAVRLPSETARTVAQNITLASIRAEDWAAGNG